MLFNGIIGNFTSIADMDELTQARYERFRGGRSAVFYTEEMQEAHHIHVPAHSGHRILQHHYAFTFFQDRNMQSFYRRFVRDYMRYKGENEYCSSFFSCLLPLPLLSFPFLFCLASQFSSHLNSYPSLLHFSILPYLCLSVLSSFTPTPFFSTPSSVFSSPLYSFFTYPLFPFYSSPLFPSFPQTISSALVPT